MSIKKKKGFTLLELILVLGVGSAMSFVKFQDIKNEQETIMAQGAGEQMRQIGEAVNRYISVRYDKLSILANAAGTGTDPGPRNCTATGCEITYQTLINEGMLPSTYTGINVQKSAYKIFLKRDGLAPNYVVNGLITTTKTWSDGGKTRYDLLGKAMQVAGVDSGMTKSTTAANGYNGQWTESNANFPNINAEGLLAYRVGYDSSLYSVFLRRDGTLPMTGDLNMGGNNISGAKDITASGTGNFGGNLATNGFSATEMPPGWSGIRTGDVAATGTLAVFKEGTSPKDENYAGYMNKYGNMYASNTITAGAEVLAHNGYGDAIAIGGDAASDDYEIRMGAAKPLSIFSPNLAASLRPTTTVFKTNGQMQVIGNQLVNNNIATNGLSYTDMPGGWQGLRTNDIVAGGTIAVKKSGTAGTAGDMAVYFNQYGNFYASNSINSSNIITASGNIRGATLLATSTVSYGSACAETGLIAKDSDGNTLVCSANKVYIKSSSVIDYFSQDLKGRLPILTSNLTPACSSVSQQAYSITFKPIQDEMFSTSFIASLTQATAAYQPVSNADYNTRINLMRTGTGCILINDVICSAQSNIEAGRTGAMSCMQSLNANQTYTVKWVLGNNTEQIMSSSRFLVQYTRSAF